MVIRSEKEIKERIKYWETKPELKKPITVIPNSALFKRFADELRWVLQEEEKTVAPTPQPKKEKIK